MLIIFFSDLYAVSLTVYLIAKFSIAMVMTSVYVYTTELYPTKHRHSLFAYSSMIGRIGSMVAPLTPAIVSFLFTLIAEIITLKIRNNGSGDIGFINFMKRFYVVWFEFYKLNLLRRINSSFNTGDTCTIIHNDDWHNRYKPRCS